ncbi:uncharacterized protein LOC120139102 [Hibiscus syriacus]|uniref:uncharacterized protein LOC120139102 n=1 Tax=Hibiscus syriacus TaxID=106335 RepID=UPI00192369CB|nr:uncharacterized protein LOC120139102 [Hibiscus syriacus]
MNVEKELKSLGAPKFRGEYKECPVSVDLWLNDVKIMLDGLHCSEIEKLNEDFLTQKELNLIQSTWIELLKDYDAIIDYYLGKANKVADALNRKTFAALRMLDSQFSLKNNGALMDELKKIHLLLERIKELKRKDDKCLAKLEQVEKSEIKDFEVKSNGYLYYRDRVYIPNDEELKRYILSEEHLSLLTMYPGGSKMYQDLKGRY